MSYNKFFANKVKYRGMTFDSQQELERYISLKAAEVRGDVGQIHRQVQLTVSPAVVRTTIVQLKTKTKVKTKTLSVTRHYTADFVYRDNKKHRIVIEDVKSKYTATLKDYALRRHMLLQMIQEHERNKRLWRYPKIEKPDIGYIPVMLNREVFIFRECTVLKDSFKVKDYEVDDPKIIPIK